MMQNSTGRSMWAPWGGPRLAAHAAGVPLSRLYARVRDGMTPKAAIALGRREHLRRRGRRKIGHKRGQDHPWSPQELRVLTLEWHLITQRELQAKLRPHSWTAIRLRAIKLGLPMGCPQGYESIERSAKRHGYDTKTWRRILTELDVSLRPAYSARPARSQRKKFQRLIVEIDEANEAARKYDRLETTGSAAKRWEVLDVDIRRYLKQCNVWPVHSKNATRRVPSVILDEIGRQLLAKRAARKFRRTLKRRVSRNATRKDRT